MKINQVIESRDMCSVCGQTPCNCTHLTESTGNIGAQIKAVYKKIYDAGDDAVEFAYYDSPIFAQYWDEYEGDLDSIIAEVEPSELQIILDELTAAAEDQGVAEGLTYAQKHSSWSVQSPKKNEFNTRYKLDQEKDARAHAERIGGKLVKVDQHGHAIRAKKGVAEGSLNEFVLPGGGGDNYGGDLHDILMAYISRNEPGLLADFGEDEIDNVVADMITMGMFDDIDPDNEEDLEDALDKIIDILNDDLPEQGVAEGMLETYYDRGDYYDAKMGGEYGRDLPQTDNRRNSGMSDKHERGGRNDVFKGQSKNLPADPFARTTGVVPKAGTGKIYTTAMPDEVDESKPKEKEADYGPEYQDMVARVKKLAGMGPLKTVYDPQKRVYKNVPTAVQPKK